MTIEELLETIPLRITKAIETNCTSCGNKHLKTCEYNLKIEITEHFINKDTIKKHYKMFYNCSSFPNGDCLKYIGKHTGLGYLTLEEAFNDLKGYLDNDNKIRKN